MDGLDDQLKFAGRDREVAALNGRLEAVRAGQGGTLLLVGEAGAGKTRLLREVGRMGLAGAMDVQLAPGDSQPGTPFGPWLELLGPIAFPAAQALPDAGRRPAPDEALRHQLHEELVSRLAATPPEGRLVLIDDLQSADHASVAALASIAPRLAGSRALVVAAVRKEAVQAGTPAGALVRTAGVEVMNVGNLDLAAIEQIVAASGVVLQAGSAEMLHTLTAGNPLFVREALRLLGAEGPAGGWHRGLIATAVPQSLVDIIDRWVARLRPESRAVLRGAAILGREFELGPLCEVVDLDRRAVVLALTEIESLGLIHAPVNRWQFTHPLVQEVVAASMQVSERAALHLRAAEQPASPLLRARHVLGAAPVVRPDQFATCVEAARWAREALGYEDAEDIANRGLDALGADGDRRLRLDLLIERGEALTRMGQTGLARSTFRAAAEIARAIGDGNGLTVAALGFAGYRGVTSWPDTEFIRFSQEALSMADGPEAPLGAVALARLAMELPATDSRRVAFAQEAIGIARASGDPYAIAAALKGSHYVHHGTGAVVERMGAGSELIRLADLAGSRELELQGRHLRVLDLLELGDTDGLDFEIAYHNGIAPELKQPHHAWHAALLLGMRALMEGRWTQAEGHANAAFGQAIGAGLANGRQAFGAQMFMVLRERGGLDVLTPFVRAFIAEFPGSAVWPALLARLHYENGRLDDAAGELAGLRPALHSLAPDEHTATLIFLLAPLCRELGDRESAAALRATGVALRERVGAAANAVVCLGAMASHLAVLAETLGDHEDARVLFEAGLHLNERIGARPFAVHTRADYAAFLIRSGSPSDVAFAASLLREAAGAASELEMAVAGGRIASLLAECESRVPAPVRHRPHGLSSREMEILRMVASGQTNREIAAALVVSVRTVDTHVAHIFQKTGARNRSEVSAYAAAAGLVRPAHLDGVR